MRVFLHASVECRPTSTRALSSDCIEVKGHENEEERSRTSEEKYTRRKSRHEAKR